MQIINTEQGSQEWLTARLGMPTASNFSEIITSKGEESKSLKKYALKLAGESLLTEPDLSFKSQAMERGNELEDAAREEYERLHFQRVDQVGLIVNDQNCGFSPDGLVGDDGIIEIKCPLVNTHFEYVLKNELPTAYKAQVQGGLFISGRKWCDFISYHPNFKMNALFVKRVERDEEFIESLADKLEKLLLFKSEYLHKFGYEELPF